jgi:4-amino-4-deoxy-L-arabinose transferase-like glycosyltransferase
VLAFLARSLTALERHAVAVVACVAAALVAVGLVYSIRLGPELPYWDEREYHELAEQLLERGEYGLEGQRAFRAPLYPFLLAALLAIGTPTAGLRFANFLLLAGSAALLFRLVRRYTSAALPGAIAALWIFAYPVLLYAAGKLYPQTLAGFLWLLALFLLLRPEPLRRGQAALAGAVYGLLCLTVPTFLPLLGLLLVWSLWQGGRRAVVPVLIVAATSAAALAPWTLRNRLVLGHSVPVATNSGVNLLLGNSENTRPELGTNVDIEDYYRRAEGLSEVERDRFYRAEALRFVREHPSDAFRLYLGKLAQYFAYQETLATASESSRLRTLALAATYLPLLALAFGRFLWWRRRPEPIEIALAVLYLANAALMAVFFTRIRFRLPVDLLLLALAGGFVGELLRRRTAPRAPR